MRIYEDILQDENDQFNYSQRKAKEFLEEKNGILSDKEEFHKFIAEFVTEKRFTTSTEIEVYLRNEKISARMDLDPELLDKFNIIKAQEHFWAKDIKFSEFQKLYPNIFSEDVKELITYDEVSSWDAEKPAGFAVKYPWGYSVRAAVYHLKNLRGMPIPFTEFDMDNPERIRMCSFDLKFPYKIRGNKEKEQEFLEVNYERVDMRYFMGNSPEEVFKNARVDS